MVNGLMVLWHVERPVSLCMHAAEALNHESEGTGGEGNIDLVLQAPADGLTGPRAHPPLAPEGA